MAAQIDKLVIKMYKKANSMSLVANELNISKRQVGRILKGNGVPSHIRHDHAAIGSEITSGQSRAAICDKYKTTYKWLNKTFGPAGKRSATGFRRFRDTVLDLNSMGMSQKEIAAKIGRNWYFVRYVLRTCGKTIQRRLDDKVVKDILEMYTSGIGSPTIAQKLGINKSTVLGYLRSNNKIRQYRTPIKPGSALRAYLRLKLCSMQKTTHHISITVDDLIRLYDTQNHRCALTNIEMAIGTNRHDSISVDRIDNTKGYELSNVRLVTRFANLARSSLSDTAFHEFIGKLIREYAPKEVK